MGALMSVSMISAELGSKYINSIDPVNSSNAQSVTSVSVTLQK